MRHVLSWFYHKFSIVHWLINGLTFVRNRNGGTATMVTHTRTELPCEALVTGYFLIFSRLVTFAYYLRYLWYYCCIRYKFSRYR
jgi:hypothetical protein